MMNQPSKWSLWGNLTAAIGAATIINVGVNVFGADKIREPDAGRFVGSIPNSVIAAVWTFLFTAMAWARWHVARSDTPSSASAAKWLLALMVLCASYPLYTDGLRNSMVGFIGNWVTILFGIVVTRKLVGIRSASASAPTMVIVWLIFASFYIADQERWWW